MLIMYIAEAYETYVIKRLLDVAIGNCAPRTQIHKKMGTIDTAMNTGALEIGELMYTVPSGSDPDVR